MALSSQVVNLGGPNEADDLDKAHAVAQIAIMEVELGVTFEMGDALAIVDRAAADDAMDIVAFADKEFRQVTAVLTSNTGD